MTTTPPPSAARRWSLLGTVATGLLLITLDNSILYTALPTLTAELGASASQSLWIINAYPLVMAGLLLGAGSLGDRVGHRRLFLVGLTVFGLASLGAAFAPSPVALVAARALLAVGAASMMPATLALIRLTFHDERERNLAVAVWGSIAVVGAALGPVVGGLLLSQFWWGSVFLVNVPVVAVALVGGVVLAPRDAPDPSTRWDLLSSVQVMVGLVGLVVAVKEVATVDRSAVVVLVALVVSAAGLVAFVRRQRRLTYPLLDVAIFANPRFSAGVVAAAAALFTIAGVQLVTTQRFQLVEGLTPLEAGLLVACLAVGTLPTAALAGARGHRIGLLPLVSGGLAVAGVGALVCLAVADRGVLWLGGGLLLVGAGLGAVMALASATIINNAPARRAGMASSVEEVSYELGSLTAVAVLGSLLTAVAGGSTGAALTEAAPADVATGFTAALAVTAAVVLAGAVVTAVLLRRPAVPVDEAPRAGERAPVGEDARRA